MHPTKSRGRRHRIARFVVVAAVLAAGVGCGVSDPYNVVIVTFDTTRADHIGCYGHEAAATPNLDALAADGVRFARAFTSVPITMPSHTTILTGTYPLQHGIRDNGLFVLGDEKLTLAEILFSKGYATAAAIGAYPLTSRFGLSQGFDFYDDHVARAFEDFRGQRSLPKADLFFDERRAARVNEAVLPWLDEHHARPFFLWVHYFDPHQPFDPPPPYDDLFFNDRYLGEIAYADESFGVVMDRLEALGVADRTVVVFAADHGEGLGDHGEMTHSVLLYNSTLQVPLIMRVPGGRRGDVVDVPVGTVDIVPTLLELLGIEIPDSVQGRSLVPELEGEARQPRPLYAETLSPRLSQGWGELRALVDGDYKYVFGPRSELYDIADDPGELRNIVDSEPETRDRMQSALESFIQDHSADEVQQAGVMDDDTRQRLAALGYVHAGGSEQTIREVLRADGTPPQDRVGDINRISSAKQALFDRRALQAKEIIETMLAEQPDNPMALEMMAAAELELGRLDAAVEVVNRIRRLFPDGTPLTGRLMLQLGALYFYSGDYGAALEMLEEGQSREPSATGYHLLAAVYEALGRTEDEVAAQEAALEQDPTHAPARIGLAIRLAERGEDEAAASQFRRAISDQPYFPRPYYNYGAFLAARDQLEEAERLFARAVEVEPSYLTAHYALVAINIGMNRSDEARRRYEALAARAPDSEEARRARRILEESL